MLQVEPTADLGEVKMPFCGHVSLSALAETNRTRLYEDMYRFQQSFLEHHEDWRPGVQWPVDALRNWSRQYEYPYTFSQLLDLKPGDRVLDAGSGITFFPFYLAIRGLEMFCADSDPRLAQGFEQLAKRLPEKASVKFQEADLVKLPYPDNYFQAVYSVSVIEHLPHDALIAVLREFSRVIQPGGLCVLTTDVAPDDDSSAIVRISESPKFLDEVRAAGLEPVWPVTYKSDWEGLLTTDHYRLRDRTMLPWPEPTPTTWRGQARKALGLPLYDPFRQLCIQALTCRSTKH